MTAYSPAQSTDHLRRPGNESSWPNGGTTEGWRDTSMVSDHSPGSRGGGSGNSEGTPWFARGIAPDAPTWLTNGTILFAAAIAVIFFLLQDTSNSLPLLLSLIALLGLSRVPQHVSAGSKTPDRADRRARDLELLYRADAYLFRSLQLSDTLQDSARVVTDVLGADKCAVWLWDSKHRCLTLEATSGFAPNTIPPVLDARRESVVSQVFLNEEPIALADIGCAVRPMPEISGVHEVRSCLTVPIKPGGRILGVLGVYYCRRRAYTTEDIVFFTSFAQRMAQAIENARLYARVQQMATLAERQRLAGDLHDSVGQSLFGVTILADAGRRQASNGNLALAHACLTRVVEATQQASRDLRLLVYDLRPLALEHDGLVAALQFRLDAVERRVGINARLIVNRVGELPPIVEDCLYRIALQALDNSLKHAHAATVRVELCADATTIELAVADDGVGFDPRACPYQGGFGLATMRERAERLGGVVTVDSQPGHGTRVLVRLPI